MPLLLTAEECSSHSPKIVLARATRDAKRCDSDNLQQGLLGSRVEPQLIIYEDIAVAHKVFRNCRGQFSHTLVALICKVTA